MNLKNIRKSLNISQLELSKKLGVDQSTISKWERGRCMPTVTMLFKLASILECKVDDIVSVR